jgi:hypothetical protein
MTPRLLAVNAFIKLTLRCHVKAFIKYSGMICIGKLKKKQIIGVILVSLLIYH